ncbi:hypothetical protein [Streptomyces erythrochromogenes]|uniref:hypothetical protein n=1 Tax=Streptomyces erythrochromogenes TaxID=285574 RepID=UPI0036D06AAC
MTKPDATGSPAARAGTSRPTPTHALAAHRGHYRAPAASEAAAGPLAPPVLAHAALPGELLRLAPGADSGQLGFAARLAATEPEAVGMVAAFLTRCNP